MSVPPAKSNVQVENHAGDEHDLLGPPDNIIVSLKDFA